MKYSEIVDHYGAKHQAIKAVEELNELAVELSKWVNGQGSRKKILEECADVENYAVADADNIRGLGRLESL